MSLQMRYAQEIPEPKAPLQGEQGEKGDQGPAGETGGTKPPKYSSAGGGTVTVTGKMSQTIRITLTGDITLALSGFKDGQKVTIAFTQDATGGRTVTWPAGVRWPDATEPTLTAAPGKRDVFGFEYYKSAGAVPAGFDGFTIGKNL